ncbi:glycosyltransferase WbsX family protein [Aquirufa regiilacus]|uniref:Glycoside hydrolase family 99-like domain-containing protein n=1 Tax=Aquirufa regiilacus TaxID=3024868 RepID=A0ABU3TSQ6_9BACT|nr:glycoside hydrolase family 99-like domain-containing protein [Aquirufa sp. LEOWEIH-7C]MDU0808904.1 glycoside hydrolase family 99-like domain-containing protein [Aquirufa sp. LEOWEIH-7C]
METNFKKVRVFAFYLPQFHPIVENDFWWGKGFTEWTNVSKAKPLFPTHYQPRIPGDLGFYDLRLQEVQEQQAIMAGEYGIDGFIYWHYWLGEGKQMMQMPIEQMFENKNITLPFALCWANHSWYAKNWNSKGVKGKDKLLLRQTYPGIGDYKNHFRKVLKFFLDDRYIRINNKPIFGLYEPYSLPDVNIFIDVWNQLAKENGLDGIHFIAFNSQHKNANKPFEYKYDSSIVEYVGSSKNINNNFFKYFYLGVLKRIFKWPHIISYKKYLKHVLEETNKNTNVFPCIVPNYDHSPRSHRAATILHNSTPTLWGKLLDGVLKQLKDREGEQFLFIKAWNEWAEGNYLEPDLKFGKKYLEVLRNKIDENE